MAFALRFAMTRARAAAALSFSAAGSAAPPPGAFPPELPVGGAVALPSSSDSFGFSTALTALAVPASLPCGGLGFAAGGLVCGRGAEGAVARGRAKRS